MADKGNITFDQLMLDLKNQIYSPVYLLQGEESYFIDEVTAFMEQNILNDLEKEFNQTIVYGRDSDVPTLVSYARRFPMMANYQVLVVREAQDLDRIEDLAGYVDKPLSSTILVLCYKYGTLDARKSLYKALSKNGVVFVSSRLYENKLPEWIARYLSDRGFTISPKAAALLTDFVGTDLSNVVNELGKLLINLPAGARIDEDHIEKNIGISKDYNIFELQSALAKKEVVKANRIIRHFAANPKENPMPKVIPGLFYFFSRVLLYHFITDRSKSNVASVLTVHPFRISEYETAAARYPLWKTVRVIALLREYDLKAKGVDNVSVPDGELMKELVYKILH